MIVSFSVKVSLEYQHESKPVPASEEVKLIINVLSDELELLAGEVILTLGDAHIYSEHYSVVEKQLERVPFKFPKLEITKEINNVEDLESLVFSDFKLVDYLSHTQLKAEMIA